MNAIKKTRAVEDALTPFMKGQSLANAVFLWEEKYAHLPTFALQHYLRELCDTTALAPLRSRMLQALIKEFSALQDDLISQAQQNTVAKRKFLTAKKNTFAEPELAIFMALVDGMIDAPGGDISVRIRLYALDNLETIRIATQQRWAIHSWLSQMDPLSNLKLELRIMQQVINLAYVALCEYLGPTKADIILQNTVDKVQQEYPDLSVQQLL